ncbi:MAG: ferrous iron transport protein B [Neisseriaceae bacterium]|jgi:ferrous iron transport protein B|nr:MAG: ferrous iron transport protein B [Neisseriaceae bacterium]
MSHTNLRIALVGKPNCGKTALFNALTGSRQKVANYAGVTIEKKHGYFNTPNKKVTLVDLPGTYSLRSRSPDEKVTRDVILNQFEEEQQVDAILAVVDATNLMVCLRLILELKQTNIPLIIAMNMSDIAKLNGYNYDINLLSQILDAPIIETTATKKLGIDELVLAIDSFEKRVTKAENNWVEPTSEELREYHKEIHNILTRIEIKKGTPSKWTEKIDNFLLHPVFGLVVLFLILFTVFQGVFTIATVPQDFLQGIFDSVQEYVLSLAPNSMLVSLIANGIIAGVGAVVVFLPQILTISLFIILLEDTGYMARAAFLMDKLMGGVGLHGRAFIPLLSSFACAIPGIMATRTIENRKDRLITIMIAPLMTCSARLPVYTLLIAAFIPRKFFLGFINLQGLVMLALFAGGVIFALIMAFIFRKTILKGDKQPLILELPSYKMPNPYNVAIELIKPAKSFLKRAGGIILSVMIIIWFLSSFPSAPIDATSPAINYSIAGMIGKFAEPLFTPIGFNWQIVVALIPGMAAREVVVSVLATIYSLSGNEEIIEHGLAVALQHSWSLATALSFITWYVFAPQCMSTLAVVKRETNSWKWPILMFIYQITLAYMMSFVVFKITSYIMN